MTAREDSFGHGRFGRRDLGRLGRIVRDRREGAGLTQRQLAEVAGISERTLGQLEGGRASPGLVTVMRVGDALGVPLPDLVAAATAERSVAVHTPAQDHESADLTGDLDAPRMHARLTHLDAGGATISTGLRPGETAFGFVLDGTVSVATRDGRSARLARSDAFHARDGVGCGLSAAAGAPARLLHITMRTVEDA